MVSMAAGGDMDCPCVYGDAGPSTKHMRTIANDIRVHFSHEGSADPAFAIGAACLVMRRHAGHTEADAAQCRARLV